MSSNWIFLRLYLQNSGTKEALEEIFKYFPEYLLQHKPLQDHYFAFSFEAKDPGFIINEDGETYSSDQNGQASLLTMQAF